VLINRVEEILNIYLNQPNSVSMAPRREDRIGVWMVSIATTVWWDVLQDVPNDPTLALRELWRRDADHSDFAPTWHALPHIEVRVQVWAAFARHHPSQETVIQTRRNTQVIERKQWEKIDVASPNLADRSAGVLKHQRIDC